MSDRKKTDVAIKRGGPFTLPGVLLLALGALAAGCEDPLDSRDRGYALTAVYHVLTQDGRRVGDLTADSMTVRGDGNDWVAWNPVVELSTSSLRIEADSMTIDWAAHEMRYYGRVSIASADRVVSAEDVIISDW